MRDPEIGLLGKLRRTAVAGLPGEVGRVVRACGWVQAAAPGGAEGSVLADGTGTVRLVLADGLAPTPGSAVESVGTVVAAAGRPGGVELVVDQLSVPGPAEPDPPLPAGPGEGPAEGPGEGPAAAIALDERLDWRYLDLRRPGPRLVLRVQTTLEQAMRAAWADAGFIEIHSPKLIPTGPRPEELFHLGYFGRRAWLAQSPQFYKQMAMAAGLDRVFEIGPVFRAEPALSPLHATEFTSVDVEMAWIDSHEDVMTSAEAWLLRAIDAVARHYGEEIAAVLGVAVEVPTAPFPRVTLAKAWEIVGAAGQAGRGGDLDREGERRLGAHAADRDGHRFVWVTDYPESTRPFYHMRSADGSSLTRSFDLLWNGVEVASGAQREHRHDRLLAQARSRGVPLEPIRHYLDFFRYGCPPHGGLGFGLARLLMCLLGLPDIREASFLARDRHRLTP